MASESEIQLLAEGTGPNVRTITVTEPQGVDTSGNAQADIIRHQQIVGTADRRGDLVGGESEVLSELRAIREILDLIRLQLA